VADAVIETPARSGFRLNVRVLLAVGAAVVAIGVVAYWFFEIRGHENTDDAFVEGHLVFLSPRVAGQVKEVLVEENQHVHAGQVLVRLDPADFEVRVDHARADLEAAKNRMAQSSAAAEAASAQARSAAVRVRHAQQELDRAQGLFERKVASQMQLDAAVAEYNTATAELRAAEQREIAERAMIANEAPVLQAQASLREAELALDHATIGAKYALLPPDNATGNFTKVVQRIPVRIALEDSPPGDVAAGPPDPLSVGLSVNVSVRVR